jgi:hypothetical protein
VKPILSHILYVESKNQGISKKKLFFLNVILNGCCVNVFTH